MSGRWIFLSVALSAIAADQAVKAWVRGALVERESIGSPWPGVFEITLTYNDGIAFGMLRGAGVLLAPIALAIVLVAAIYSFRHSHQGRAIHLAMGALAGGAIGNLIDRLWLGKVTDMFWFRLIDFPVFNVADACITVSAVLMMLIWTFEAKATPAPQEAEPPPEVPSAETPQADSRNEA